MKCLALITARGGSKRIPRKNIRNFHGKTILAYSIQAAKNTGIFDEIMVSTDDTEIAEIAVQNGAKVPFTRSKKNSDDFSTTADVILEVLKEYAAKGTHFDLFCCIYPTAPLVDPEKIKAGLQLLKKNKADAAIPVARFGFPIQRALMIQDEMLQMENPQHLKTRSQDLPARYHDAGQFYCGKTDYFLKNPTLIPPRTAPILLDDLEAQDIDTEEDWQIAELKFSLLKQKRILL